MLYKGPGLRNWNLCSSYKYTNNVLALYSLSLSLSSLSLSPSLSPSVSLLLHLLVLQLVFLRRTMILWHMIVILHVASPSCISTLELSRLWVLAYCFAEEIWNTTPNNLHDQDSKQSSKMIDRSENCQLIKLLYLLSGLFEILMIYLRRNSSLTKN